MPLAELTDFTVEAQRMLRDPATFEWSTVTLLVLVMYVYANEVQHRRWDVVFAGLAFWLADWMNEIVNSLVLHFTERAPLWAVTGDTSYLILIGLTVEISLMFAVSGLVYVKLLPSDRDARVLGMPNRLFYGLALSLLAVFVEVLLHEADVFHWEYWFWNVPFVVPIVLFGYLWFFLVAAHVYDMRDTRRQARFVGTMAAIVAAALILCGPVLEWI